MASSTHSDWSRQGRQTKAAAAPRRRPVARVGVDRYMKLTSPPPACSQNVHTINATAMAPSRRAIATVLSRDRIRATKASGHNR